jgi:isopenicillin-N N-acyltransferase-like protein
MSGWLDCVRREMPKQFSDAELDAAWASISPYTSDRVKQELRGLADGSGVPYKTLRRAHMIPVVADYACSGVIAWGQATKNGHRLQLRNLDFGLEPKIHDYPLIVVYLPRRGIPHANVTIAGFIGSHTGMNAKGVVLGEKGESPQKEYPFNLNGSHFALLFRDLLYDAGTLDEAVRMIQSAKRIKRYYWYVSGPGAPGGGVKVKVTSPDAVTLRIWKDDDKTDELYPNVLKNVVYHTMNNELAYKQLKADWGQLDPPKMIALSRAVASTGGNHTNVVYDGDTLEMWVAYAEKNEFASTRPYVHVNLRDYLDPSKIPVGAIRLPSP